MPDLTLGGSWEELLKLFLGGNNYDREMDELKKMEHDENFLEESLDLFNPSPTVQRLPRRFLP